MESFFDYYHIEEEFYHKLAFFAMQDCAFSWYDFMQKFNNFQTWDHFVKALMVQYGPFEYDWQGDRFDIRDDSCHEHTISAADNETTSTQAYGVLTSDNMVELLECSNQHVDDSQQTIVI